ncbi:MAG: hypothetical protein VB027_08990 [Gordonibacter sp.]|nr:hypothetical protein [Gordonibacter sp.]
MATKWDCAKLNLKREEGLKMASRKAVKRFNESGCKGIRKIGVMRDKAFLTYSDQSAKHYVEVRFLLTTREYIDLKGNCDAHRDLYAVADRYGARDAREQRHCIYESFVVIGLETGELVFHEPASAVRNRC